MKSLKKQRRIQIFAILGLVLLLAVPLLGYAFRDGINYFRSPSEVIAEPPRESETFRIGGLVESGSLIRGEGATIRFSVTDGGASIPVEYTGVLPDLFEEGQGMVGTGSYINETFQAVEILAKHDETYMPKEVVDALKAQGVYKDPNGEVSSD
ncbi:MAG: cytochrome c maturation protein CcmE [Paracoccaceae bacterium]